jgi:hypothetical protein
MIAFAENAKLRPEQMDLVKRLVIDGQKQAGIAADLGVTRERIRQRFEAIEKKLGLPKEASMHEWWMKNHPEEAVSAVREGDLTAEEARGQKLEGKAVASRDRVRVLEKEVDDLIDCDELESIATA